MKRKTNKYLPSTRYIEVPLKETELHFTTLWLCHGTYLPGSLNVSTYIACILYAQVWALLSAEYGMNY